jgi:FtsP/CotA-like multicopper oxidase with cupredoxin domain
MNTQVTSHPSSVVAPVGRIVKFVRRLRARREIDRSMALVSSAALLTLGAAAIHFAVAPEHLAEYMPYGVFFIGLGIVQVGLAAAIMFVPSRRLFATAAAGTGTVMGIWLLSRTAGMPIPWSPEPVGFTDVVTTLLEGIAVIQFLRLFRRPGRPRHRGRIRLALSMVPVVLFAPFAAFLGVGAALAPMPAAYNAAPAVPGQASTSVVDLTARPGSEPIKKFTLTAAVRNIGGHEAWTFNGTVPGPELRVKTGDRVMVTLVNHLPDATSIHWHGINVPNAMDGVAGITQDALKPGGTFTYDFVAKEVGTYWYHSHQDTSHQITDGLIGSIVVEPTAEPAANARDYSLLVHTQPGGDAIAVNGTSNLRLDAAPGETVRLRIINAVVPGFGGAPLTPVLVGAPYVVEALDGRDLNAPQQLGPERLQLGMGQRADLVFTMPDKGGVRVAGLKGNALLPWSAPPTASVTIGDGPIPGVNVSTLPTFDLTRYGLSAADPVADAAHYDVTRDIVLGGGPTFRNGSFDFSDTFDGMASPFVPPIRVREGQLVRLHIVNNSPKFHPIHIHGHVFSVLAKNGHRLTGSPVHVDAVLVAPGETWDVAFKADNPGIWMLHCHVLAHASAGMSMTINYEGIYTPFTMGTQSGNIPE